MRTQYKYDLDFYKQLNYNFITFGSSDKKIHFYFFGLTDETGLASLALAQAKV